MPYTSTAEDLALAIFAKLGGVTVTNRHSASLEDILHDVLDVLGGGIPPGGSMPTLRAGEVSAPAGVSKITFSAAMPDANFIILCTATDAAGAVAFFVDPALYTVNDFTINLLSAALVTYTAIKKA